MQLTRTALLLSSASAVGGLSSNANANVNANAARTITAQKSAPIQTDSAAGRRILSQARSLDQNQQQQSFVSSYSIKFQGCHHITQWNSDAEDEDDVRVATKRLVRFRLCPSTSCNSADVSGCSEGYGDYVIDMNQFVESYLQGVEEQREYQCQMYEEACNNQCDGNDDDYCEQACYTGYGLSYCFNDEEEEGFNVMEYAQCGQFEFNNNNGRNLENNNNNNNNGNYGNKYFIGPHCADQGGEIHFGLFSDDTCTTFSTLGDDGFASLAGFTLPYSSESLVSDDCISCAEGQGNNANDNNDADNVAEMCENIYGLSGKCETEMSVAYPNTNACNYIEGIKIVREGGIIRTNGGAPSQGATIAIVLLTIGAALLGAYVCYLKTRLGQAKMNLANSGLAYA